MINNVRSFHCQTPILLKRGSPVVITVQKETHVLEKIYSPPSMPQTSLSEHKNHVFQIFARLARQNHWCVGVMTVKFILPVMFVLIWRMDITYKS